MVLKQCVCVCVSVGDQCGCSSYSALIYALSSAVGVAAVLILVVVVMYRVSIGTTAFDTTQEYNIKREYSACQQQHLRVKSVAFSSAVTNHKATQLHNLAAATCKLFFL